MNNIEKTLSNRFPGEYLKRTLEKSVPEFNLELKEHLQVYNEINPYLLMNELSLFFTKSFRNEDSLRDRLINFLESLLTIDSNYYNTLVYLGFLENLNKDDVNYLLEGQFLKGELLKLAEQFLIYN